MSIKTITTVVNDGSKDRAGLEAAIVLARAAEAHLDVVALGIDRSMPVSYYAGANALIMQTGIEEAQRGAKALEDEMTQRLQREDIRSAVSTLTAMMATITTCVAQSARFSDLVVLPRPYGEGKGTEDEVIIEAALFGAGVPVLVVPGETTGRFRRIVVAWNESAEALRAIRAALPLLIGADLVNIAIINPPPHSPERSDPGGELTQMLARHGARAEVSVLARTMPRIADVLCRHASDFEADLIVMGAYGHSRFRESIMGGATRHMLEQATVPVYLAH